MRVVLAIFLCFITVSQCHAWLEFDGRQMSIPGDEWQILLGDERPTVQEMARHLDEFNWAAMTDKIVVNSVSGEVLRLDLRVTYSGGQRPLLVIPYAFIPNLSVALVKDHSLVMWKSLTGKSEFSERTIKQIFGMVVLPIDTPGDYTLLIKSTAAANSVIVRGAKLHLDQDFMLREYPAATSTATAIMGALSTFLIFCVAVIFYRFRTEFIFALLFLAGAFGSILLREGVLFLSWDLDPSWWITRFLPLAIGMSNAGAMLYVCSDYKQARGTLAWKIIKWSGIAALAMGLINVVLPMRDHQFYSVPGFAIVMFGSIVALVVIVKRAWRGSLRERLFAVFIGSYFLVSLGRFLLASLNSTINIPVLPMYLTFYLFGVFVFVEYLITLTREYIDKRAQRTAEKARVDLVNRFSHELRTPLNAVIGLADLIKDSPGQRSTESYASMIQSAGNTLLDLVDDILDFSKLGETGIPLARRPIRLDKLTTEVLTGFIPQAMETKIIPKVVMQPDVQFFVLGDEVRLKQIFSNLVANAIKFSPPNEFVVVTIGQGAVDDQRVELICSVQDKGRGIPPEKQGMIFEPYAQASAEDGSHLRGTGLGLAICKLLIEQMEGHISVSSVQGEGTTFSFNLWLDVDPSAPDLKDSFQSLREKQVLIISALESVVDYLPVFLRHWGSVVEVVSRCELATRKHYDLVLVESLYHEASNCADWINAQPPETIIEVVELRSSEWASNLTHPGVHRLMVPISILTLLATFSEHLGGELVDLGDEKFDGITLHNVRHSVLLVDDNIVNLTVGSKLLESLGVKCEVASGGRECLDKLAFDFDSYTMVLLDCEMPELNGFEVCRRWRRQEAERQLPRLPIVALTAHALLEVKNECLAAGMNEVVYKPIGREAMIELLNRYPDHLTVRH